MGNGDKEMRQREGMIENGLTAGAADKHKGLY